MTTGPVERRRALASLALLALTTAFAGVFAATRAVLPGRPAPSGTSATRCALCGASDHTMLDPRCPAARRVFS